MKTNETPNAQARLLQLMKDRPDGVTRPEAYRVCRMNDDSFKNALKRLREKGYDIKATRGVSKDETVFKLQTNLPRGNFVRNAGDDRERVYNFIKRQASPPSSSTIATALKIDRQRVQNFLLNLQQNGFITNTAPGKSVAYWAARERTKAPESSRNPICAGTMTEPLKMANYWTAPYRPGIDATNNIPSRGF